MDNIRVFELSLNDVEWLSKVANRAYFDTYTHLWFDNGAWYAHRCFNVEQLKTELSDTNALFFGVEDAEEGLGFLKLNVDTPLSKNACQSDYLELLTFDTNEHTNALELERIYLTKKGQGRGIGRHLVELTFGLARSNNKEVVWLKAMDTSADAIGFYKKMGFTNCATMRLNFEKMKPEMRGMISMRYQI